MIATARTARIGVLAVLAAVLAVGIVVMSGGSDEADAATGDTFTVDGLTYEITGDDEVTLTGYDVSVAGSGVTIPATVTYDAEYRVVAVDASEWSGPFYQSGFIDTISVESPYISSLDYLCWNCSDLNSVDLSGATDVTSMGYAFFGCTSLTTAPAIPSSVTEMEGTFSGCTSLTTAPAIPSSVTNMGYAFFGCTSLTTAPAIPSSVTNMGYAFSGCTSLTTAPAIPSSVTEMEGTFSDCTSLTTAPAIPSSVTEMGGTFSDCTSLTTAPAIPSSVTEMGGTFSGCTSLTTAPAIPSSVTRTTLIFQGCTSLEAWGQDNVWTKFTGSFSNMFKNTSQSIYINLDEEGAAAVNAAFGSEKFIAPTVVFDANGGDAIATIDTGFTAVLPTTASREAADSTTYALAYFEADDGTIYEPGATVEDVRSLTLTARWYATTTATGEPGALSDYGSLVLAIPLILVIGVVVAVLGYLVARRGRCPPF